MSGILTPKQKFAVGSVLGRRYEVAQILGSGKLGISYLVKDRDLGRSRVVLKVFYPNIVSRQEVVLSLKEAFGQVRPLSHPNIRRVYDFVQLASGGWGIAHEYVSGVSLAGLLSRVRSQPLTPAEALVISLQISRGLQFAHDAGISHGNLHPQNIILSRDGSVKVCDFYLNSAVPPESGLTSTRTTFMGVPRYLAPEQISGSGTTSSKVSDAFSFAVICAELISSSPRNTPAGLTDQLKQQFRLQLSDFGELKEEISPELRELLENALQARPALRTVQVKEIGDEIQKILGERASTPLVSKRDAETLTARLLREPDLDKFRAFRVLLIALAWIGGISVFGQDSSKTRIMSSALVVERALHADFSTVYSYFGLPDVSLESKNNLENSIRYPKPWLFLAVIRAMNSSRIESAEGGSVLQIFSRVAKGAELLEALPLGASELRAAVQDPSLHPTDRFVLHEMLAARHLPFASLLRAAFNNLMFVRDAQGRTPLDLAAELNLDKFIESSLGGDSRFCNGSISSGRSPYHWAAAAGALASLEVLNRAGCASSLPDLEGSTPLALALRFAPSARLRKVAELLGATQSVDPEIHRLLMERGLADLLPPT